MQRLLIGVSLLFLLNSCSEIEEGFLGEWEGTINQFNASGKLVEVNTSCEIKSKSGNERSVLLTVGGNAYDFVGIEMLDEMTYEDYILYYEVRKNRKWKQFFFNDFIGLTKHLV